jgi:hypothetical protein
MAGVIDAHVHIQPHHQVLPAALKVIRGRIGHRPELAKYLRSPAKFVEDLDRIGASQAWLINYVAPEVIGFTAEANDWVAAYARDFPDRLKPFGSVHPLHAPDCKKEAERLLSRLELSGIKIHPPHQGFAPNAYRETHRFRGLRHVYAAAERHRVPVMVHTGTSVFPGARSRLGDPMLVDDVAVDFPDLRIVLAHGGRPLWCDAAFFLARRHRNVLVDLSSIPPRHVPRYFPRLEELPGKFLFGSDWPGPGVPGIAENLEAFRGLPWSEGVRTGVLGGNARRLLAR